MFSDPHLKRKPQSKAARPSSKQLWTPRLKNHEWLKLVIFIPNCGLEICKHGPFLLTFLFFSFFLSGSEPHLQPTPQLTAMPDPSPTEQGQGSNPQPHCTTTGTPSPDLSHHPFSLIQTPSMIFIQQAFLSQALF